MSRPISWIDEVNEFVRGVRDIMEDDVRGKQDDVGGRNLEIEVPGASAKDVSVTVNGGHLTVTVKGRRPFTRQYLLSVRVDPSNIRATVKDGLLTLEFNKTEKPSATVPVSDG